MVLLFAREDMHSYAVAKLQPLRIFQFVYVITILIVGGAIGQLVLRSCKWRWGMMIASVGVLMFVVQLYLFPDSNHLEFPWTSPSNGWEQAFLWIRANTPESAVIAMDADYITARGEDAQNFRAIAERSAIPDYSKDGGIASIAPDLTAAWMIGETAQKGLDRETDAERLIAIRTTQAGWMVLSRSANTAFPCAYANALAKVCRVPNGQEARAITDREYRSSTSITSNVPRTTDPTTARHWAFPGRQPRASLYLLTKR